jgi:hypothetical protein
MARGYSNDLRVRVIEFVEAGESGVLFRDRHLDGHSLGPALEAVGERGR